MVSELPALSESSDDVKSRRQFSQEHCEPENSQTGQTVREVPKCGNKNIERLTVVTACAKDTSQWTQRTLFFFFFFYRWPYGTLTVKWRETFFSAKYLSSLVNADKILPKNDSCHHHRKFKPFFSRSNRRRGLTDTINTAHVILYLIKMFLHTGVCSLSYVLL